MPAGIYSAVTTHKDGRTICPMCIDFDNKGNMATGGAGENVRDKKTMRKHKSQLQKASKQSKLLSEKLQKKGKCSKWVFLIY